MLILILIDDQYLQDVTSSFEKDLNGQNYSTSDSHRLTRKSPQQSFSFPPEEANFTCLFNSIWKNLRKKSARLWQEIYV